MEEESIRIWLEEEDGQEREYEAIGSFAVEDQDYMALRPMEDAKGDEVILLGFHEEEGDCLVLDPIEDLEEYERIGEIFLALFNGEAEIEPDDGFMTETEETDDDSVQDAQKN